MNRIAIDEDEQMEILDVQTTQMKWMSLEKKIRLTDEGKRVINNTLKIYQSELKGIQISLHGICGASHNTGRFLFDFRIFFKIYLMTPF